MLLILNQDIEKSGCLGIRLGESFFRYQEWGTRKAFLYNNLYICSTGTCHLCGQCCLDIIRI